MAETNEAAFARGVTAGEIAEQLKRHENHLSKINGSTEKTALAIEAFNRTQQKMELQLQRLADQAEADSKTRVATAAALKDADEARRTTADRAWSPVARAIALIGALAAVASITAFILAQR